MPNPLAYADPLAERGIVYDRWPRGVRITIPPSRRWRSIALVALPLTNPVLLLTILLGVGFGRAYARKVRGLFSPTVIEVSDTAVSLLNIDAFEYETDAVRPREAVYDVKYVSHSGHLVVRARGHDMIECRPVRDAAVLAQIEQLMRDALGLPAS